MNVLVTASSKHGATEEIAEKIGSELAGRGFEVTRKRVEEVSTLGGYEAVVLGSAVYMGKWMKAAKELATREASALSAIPVWLFSSGPIGKAASKPDPATVRRATRSRRRSERASTACSRASSTASG
jgi:menaquinone-dependent protoporphyrinogen oxidase